MPPLTRRALGRLLAVGGAGTVAAIAGLGVKTNPPSIPSPRKPLAETVIADEKLTLSSTSWVMGAGDTRPADDIGMQIKGFASTTSAVVGDRIDFHVTVAGAEPFDIGIYRLGDYNGLGARRIAASPALTGTKQPDPKIDAKTGLISCDWAPSWSVSVPSHWAAGYYLAVFTTASGWRSYTPFMVHDSTRSGGLCVVMPFSTYQAYNQWPFDGATGKSLYYGYEGDASIDFEKRAFQVSFDRPYYKDGLPKLFDDDYSFIKWVDKAGYNVNYASTVDIESGRLDPTKYSGFIFPGHDEYWSANMRTWAEHAFDGGKSMAFLGANSVYWKIQFGSSSDGRENRVITCYKTEIGPIVDGSLTMRWRDGHPGPVQPEQAFLGVQYNGIVSNDSPLVVQQPDHWVWNGCDVTKGHKIDLMVGIEADGFDPTTPAPTGVVQTLLTASPYLNNKGETLVQNTSVYETDNGAVMFVAGTLHWTKGLGTEKFANWRIMRATKNVFERMLRPDRILS